MSESASVEKVKQLREETAAGMMDVKRALDESGGDLEGARRVLKEKGQAQAEKKKSREVQEGVVECYIHFNGRLGVMVEVNCETDFVARTPEFREFARNVAMHIASMNPSYVSEEDVPGEEMEEQRQIFEKQAAEMGKPDNVTAQIAQGRLNKWLSERTLLDQSYVKDEEKTVRELLTDTIASIGENIVIRRFTRYEI